MPEKIAFLFPGQGSQFIGMGRDIMEESPEAKEIFGQLDEICGNPVSNLCFQGPMEDLTLTVNLQPAVTAVNLAFLTALNRAGIHASISAGHSLGEYSALASAGVINRYDCLRLVKKRGELMHRESLIKPGGMAAILGLDIDLVTEIVEGASAMGVISIANHNTSQQIVITGEKDPLTYSIELAKEKGGKAIPLKVSGAWHCDLMKDAVDDFHGFMVDIQFAIPGSPVLFNATAAEENDPEKIKELMAMQLISPVRWYDIVLRMLDRGVNAFIEVGPKNVLAGLLGKIISKDREAKVYNVGDLKSLKGVVEILG